MFFRKFVIRGFSALALAVSLLACTPGQDQPGDPKQRLGDYISRSFAVRGPEDRKELMSYLAGEAKTRLASWSDDQFRQAFVESKRQFVKLAFREIKAISPKETEVTYEIVYLDQSKGHDARVTNKKLAQMVMDQGRWYVADVHNIKELVEYQNEMSLP